MDYNSYIFLGVGVALSVLGFFLKKEAKKQGELDERVKALEVRLAKNEVRDSVMWQNAHKMLDDRRADCIKIYEKLETR